MKKIILLAVVAASFAACNNSGENSENKDTTTIVKQDTMGVVTDTTITRDTIGQGLNNNPTTADTTKR